LIKLTKIVPIGSIIKASLLSIAPITTPKNIAVNTLTPKEIFLAFIENRIPIISAEINKVIYCKFILNPPICNFILNLSFSLKGPFLRKTKNLPPLNKNSEAEGKIPRFHSG
jgi:hypothetical protein